MDLKQIYEKVNLRVPLEQRRFFNHFNDTAAEIFSMYPDFACEEGKHYTPVSDLADECCIREQFGPAIVDNILFLSGYDKDGSFKSEFLRKAQNAYISYWRDKSHHKRIQKPRW